MIDLHCHLLPGIDDGPATAEESLALARAQLESGTDWMVCTPHVNQQTPNRAAAIAERTEALRVLFEEQDVQLWLATGGEVAMTYALDLDDDELSSLHLGGGGYLLLEPPLTSAEFPIESMVSTLQARGHKVLIAHPERCAIFHRDADVLERLVRGGALAQVTATSLTGSFGRTAQKLATAMLDAELVHVISSDAHGAESRRPGIIAPMERSGYGWLADWAGHELPAAILSGDPLPPRPTRPGAGRRRPLGALGRN